MNEITYVMRIGKNKGKFGLIISEVRRIGQCYAQVTEGGYWAPRGVFEVKDVWW